MPKRHGDLYASCTSADALWRAYRRARRSKRGKAPVQAFERDLGANIQALADTLAAGTYTPEPYHTFWVHEPKPRLIHAPAFRDRVVQHAIYETVYPIFDRGFIDQSYACRIGKGTHAAADQAQRYLRQSPPGTVTLSLDIRKFFYRVDRTILRRQVEDKIKDKRLINLMMLFADGPEPLGVPIGNLLSQLFALIYLNPLDHYIKRDMKVKRYVRYVDDFVLFGLARADAHDARRQIEEWLAQNLRLELSKWSVQPLPRGVNFVGYRTWRRTRFIRRHSLHTFSRRLRQGHDPALRSLLAHARHTGSHRHLIHRLKQTRPDLAARLPASLGAKGNA